MDASECSNEKQVFLEFAGENKNWNDSSESLQKLPVKEITTSDSSSKIDQIDFLLLQSQSLTPGQDFLPDWVTPPIAKVKVEPKLAEEAVLYVKAKNSNSGELAVLRVTLSRPQSRILAEEMPNPDNSIASPVKISIIDITEGSESAPKDKVPWKYIRRRKEYSANTDTLKTCIGHIHFHSSKVLSKRRSVLTCPNCTFVVKSQIKHVVTFRTKRASFFMIPVGLCFLPYMLFIFMDTVHLCPYCNSLMGTSPAFYYRKKRDIMVDFLTPVSFSTFRKLRRNVHMTYKNTIDAWTHYRKSTRLIISPK
ncbi:UNVERIFIED_CONTAM: hypothetical protein PYX00_001784 [Menopon gallinae]|uniref:LITAF domain-containing protein n=1 Tax=Menopon gallinae TaxID=328185 RepID=A0AAW2IEE6_9NEOP